MNNKIVNDRVFIGLLILASLVSLTGVATAATLNVSGQVHEILYAGTVMTIGVGQVVNLSENYSVTVDNIDMINRTWTIGVNYQGCRVNTNILREGYSLGTAAYVDGVRVPTLGINFVSMDSNNTVTIKVTQVSISYPGMVSFSIPGNNCVPIVVPTPTPTPTPIITPTPTPTQTPTPVPTITPCKVNRDKKTDNGDDKKVCKEDEKESNKEHKDIKKDDKREQKDIRKDAKKIVIDAKKKIKAEPKRNR